MMKGAALWAASTLIAGAMASKEALAQKAAKGSMQYQDKPNGDKQCSNCALFIPHDSCQIVGLDGAGCLFELDAASGHSR